jgi:hypothetical protein
VKLEIVTHCWRYSRLLTYQLSSLAIHPPKRVNIRVSVYYSKADEETAGVLAFFADRVVPHVEWNWCELQTGHLFRRAIGRNHAALSTTADWVWFTDADYCFGDGCLDSLPLLLESVRGPLAFPRWVQINKTHQLGDATVGSMTGDVQIRDLTRSDFAGERMNRATGGIQIARGDVCRKLGYCNGMTHCLRPARRWTKCVEDVTFRKCLGTRGQAIALPSVYRIRHSVNGRNDPTIAL